jgi:hypothetical protein
MIRLRPDLRTMRLTVKAIDDELKRLGHDAQLVKGDGYFYFTSGETRNWLDRTVKVPTLSSLTLEQWMEEFEKLKDLNKRLLTGQPGEQPSAERASGSKSQRKKGNKPSGKL